MTTTIVIVFAVGYLLGGITALLIVGLAVAARRGDHGRAASAPRVPVEETVAAWRHDG